MGTPGTRSNLHAFVSAKSDPADATLVKPSNWNAQHNLGEDLTLTTGQANAVLGSVAIANAAVDNAVLYTTVQGDLRSVFVALAAITNGSDGLWLAQGVATVLTQGVVTRGNYIRCSTTSQRAEDTSFATPTDGAFAIALTGSAGGAASITAYLLGFTYSAARPGTIYAWGGAGAAPVGSVLCDGTLYNGNNQPFVSLWNAIGTTWGGTGQASFAVPDLRGRTVIGSGTGPGLTARTTGSTGGEENHVLITGELPAHSHTMNNAFGSVNSTGSFMFITSTAAGTAIGGFSTDNTGGGSGHNNMQPWAAPVYVIHL